MNLYEYIPPKSNKKAIGASLILISFAAGSFIFTLLFPTIPFRWGVQLISILAFVAFVFIISRYVSKKFLYAIIENDEKKLDFTVTEITNAGRTKITVCRISINDIERSYLLDCTVPENQQKLKNLKKTAKEDGRKSFNYCPDINPAEVCVLIGEECGEKYLIILSPNDTLWEYLNTK